MTETAPRPPMNDAEIRQAVDAYAAGQSIRAVAAQLGRTYGAIHRALDRAGVEFRERGRPAKGSPCGTP